MKTSSSFLKYSFSFWKLCISVLLPSLLFLSEQASAQKVFGGEGTYTSYAIDQNGNLYTWGKNTNGQLGIGTTTNDSIPVIVAFPTGVTSWTAIAGGASHTVAIGNDGNLYTWGLNTNGQLGDGTTNQSTTPIKITVAGVTSWKAVAAGDAMSFAIGGNDSLYSWGYNNFGQLGDSSTTQRTSPVTVHLPSGVLAKAVSAAANSAMALGTNDSLYAWGRNANGQLGIGSTADQRVPVAVHLPAGVTATVPIGGAFYNSALCSDGNIYAWGQNTNGQIGDATTTQRTSPTMVTKPNGVTSWLAATSGASFLLAIGNNDSLYAWGYNGTGELGVASGTNNNTTPLNVALPAGVLPTSLAAGHNHSLIVGSDGYLYAWGRNLEGQLGNNSTVNNGSNSVVNMGKVFGMVPVAPEVPILLSPANNASDQPTSLTLKWSKSPNAAGYQCQLSLDATFATNLVVNDSTLTDTTRGVTNLGTSTVYYWRVRSYNNGVLSAFSNVDSFTTVVQAPSAPTLISPAGNAVNQPAMMTLICSAASGAAQYHWQVSTDFSFTTFVVNDSTTDTMRVVNLMSGTKYYWQVQAVNPGGASAFAGPDSFTVMTAPTVSPILISPVNNAIGQRADTLVLKWSSVANATGYECQLSLSSSFSTLVVARDSTTDTTFKVTSLNHLQKYFWRVRAYNVGGATAFSEMDSFTTIIAAPVRPSPVSPLAAVNVPRKTTFIWYKSSTATSYHLEVATTSDFGTIAFDTTVVDTSVQLSSPLASSTQYFWHVNASNAGGTSAYSVAGNFTTGTLLEVAKEKEGIPTEFALQQNYPNPFNPSTKIKYSLPEAQTVLLKVYNVLGQEVATLVNMRQNAGYYEVSFNAGNLPSGIFFYVLKAGNFTAIHKMLLLK